MNSKLSKVDVRKYIEMTDSQLHSEIQKVSQQIDSVRNWFEFEPEHRAVLQDRLATLLAIKPIAELTDPARQLC